MSKKFDIKPPTWPRELTFEEFKKHNPLINENQVVNLYNQYLAKFLNELRQQKLHFKQSKNTQLVSEIQKFRNLNIFDDFSSTHGPGMPPGPGQGGGFNYICFGIGCYTVGTYGYHNDNSYQSPVPVDSGFPRFTVGRPVVKYLPYVENSHWDEYSDLYYGSTEGAVGQTDWDPPNGDASGLNP
tara:strand:- start:2384 stop:2935 length:552 start_codon:yes stop_codon:yes gene_type:complete